MKKSRVFMIFLALVAQQSLQSTHGVQLYNAQRIEKVIAAQTLVKKASTLSKVKMGINKSAEQVEAFIKKQLEKITDVIKKLMDDFDKWNLKRDFIKRDTLRAQAVNIQKKLNDLEEAGKHTSKEYQKLQSQFDSVRKEIAGIHDNALAKQTQLKRQIETIEKNLTDLKEMLPKSDDKVLKDSIKGLENELTRFTDKVAEYDTFLAPDSSALSLGSTRSSSNMSTFSGQGVPPSRSSSSFKNSLLEPPDARLSSMDSTFLESGSSRKSFSLSSSPSSFNINHSLPFSGNNTLQNSLRSSNSGSLSFQNFSSNSFTGTDLPKNVQSSSLRSQIEQSISTPMAPPLRPNKHTDFNIKSTARKTAAKVLTDEETIKKVLWDLLEGKLYTKSVDEWFDGFDSVKSKWSTMGDEDKKDIIWKIFEDPGEVDRLDADSEWTDFVSKIAKGESIDVSRNHTYTNDYLQTNQKKFRQWAELIGSKNKDDAKDILTRNKEPQAAFRKTEVKTPKSESQINAENAAYKASELKKQAEKENIIKAENAKIAQWEQEGTYKAARSGIEKLFDNPKMSGSSDILKAWKNLVQPNDLYDMTGSEKGQAIINNILIDRKMIDPDTFLTNDDWKNLIKEMAEGGTNLKSKMNNLRILDGDPFDLLAVAQKLYRKSFNVRSL